MKDVEIEVTDDRDMFEVSMSILVRVRAKDSDAARRAAESLLPKILPRMVEGSAIEGTDARIGQPKKLA